MKISCPQCGSREQVKRSHVPCLEVKTAASEERPRGINQESAPYRGGTQASLPAKRSIGAIESHKNPPITTNHNLSTWANARLITNGANIWIGPQEGTIDAAEGIQDASATKLTHKHTFIRTNSYS